MKQLISKPSDNTEFTNELTALLDQYLEDNLKNQGRNRHYRNYIMAHTKDNLFSIYAIRYPGATRGSIVTDANGVIVKITLDLEFYGAKAEEAVKKYIGYQLVLEAENPIINGKEIKAQYTWNFDPNSDCWNYGIHDSIEECLKTAETENMLDKDKHAFVYIAEIHLYKPEVDAFAILENLEEAALEHVGELADGWEAINYKTDSKDGSLDALSRELTAVVTAWLEKKNRMPDFYLIDLATLKRYALKEEKYSKCSFPHVKSENTKS